MRGQVSVEFLYAIGILTLIFSGMTTYAWMMHTDAQTIDSNNKLRGECLVLANAIVGAASNPLAESQITMFHAFEIKARSKVIVLEGEITCRLPTSDVTDGSFPPDRYTVSSLANGSVSVSNE